MQCKEYQWFSSVWYALQATCFHLCAILEVIFRLSINWENQGFYRAGKPIGLALKVFLKVLQLYSIHSMKPSDKWKKKKQQQLNMHWKPFLYASCTDMLVVS